MVRWRVGEGCLAPRRDPEPGPSGPGFRGLVSEYRMLVVLGVRPEVYQLKK